MCGEEWLDDSGECEKSHKQNRVRDTGRCVREEEIDSDNDIAAFKSENEEAKEREMSKLPQIVEIIEENDRCSKVVTSRKEKNEELRDNVQAIEQGKVGVTVNLKRIEIPVTGEIAYVIDFSC